MSEKFTDKNSYTIMFTVVMVIIVATVLTLVSLSLRPQQQENYTNEKMQNILKSIEVLVERDQAPAEYNKYIKEGYVFDKEGNLVSEDKEDAFNIDTSKDKENFPMFVAEKEGKTYNIIPVRGVGLWDAIWGYVAFNPDLTINGAVFDHKGETPGLGAEITQEYFQDQFEGEHVYTHDGKYQGIVVQKGYTDTENKTDGIVNAISGATITAVGVGEMINNSIGPYQNYLKKK